MERKEQWINQIMDTEVYINQAKPSQALQARLKRIPNTLSVSYIRLPKKVVWSVAASIAVLICMNFIAVNEYSSNTSSSSNSTELMDSHFSYLTQIEL
ncbi:MAG: hypothetical protein P8N52_06320 [Crocinitomicaceae bacterium]|nr:hypothetical protein [Crocinitomicaceae bacterium]MDG1777698.1 hypothetical protein [Crocinitomicaceae bacterium]